MTRRFPAEGINLFQSIYQVLADFEAGTGLPALNLSLGNPDSVPPDAVRELKARFAGDPGLVYHTYAEQNDLNGFSEAMVELHSGIRPASHPHLRCLPIPGIKTASALIPLACGLHRPSKRSRERFCAVVNQPAYDVLGAWTGSYLGGTRVAWPLSSANGMRLDTAELEFILKASGIPRADLIFVIRPGNPAPVAGRKEEWEPLIRHCLERDTRLVCDGAYAGLTGGEHMPLAEAAKEHPDLEWLELFSVSKSFSDPGARLGALVGSKDFVEDMAMIKGHADSGPVPAFMAAYGEFFKDGEAARAALESLRDMYRARLGFVIGSLEKAGLKQACPAEAGFFSFWKVPREAFGISLEAFAAERGVGAHAAFNTLVTEKTGIVGVHFCSPAGAGEAYVRYAVCSDVLALAFKERFESGLRSMEPRY